MCFWRFWVWKEVHALGDKAASLTQVRTCCNHVSLGPPPPRRRAPPHLLACPACCAPDDRPLGPWTLPWAPCSRGRSSHHRPGFPRTLHWAPAQPSLGWEREVPRRQRSSHKWSDSQDAGCLINQVLGRENMVCRRKSLGHLLGLGLLVCNPLLTVVKSLDVGIIRASARPRTERLWVSHLTSLSLNTQHFWKSVNLISRLTTDESNEPVSLP